MQEPKSNLRSTTRITFAIHPGCHSESSTGLKFQHDDSAYLATPTAFDPLLIRSEVHIYPHEQREVWCVMFSSNVDFELAQLGVAEDDPMHFASIC
jgi:hypothetical protein